MAVEPSDTHWGAGTAIEFLRRSVERGGGSVVDLGDAEALVWAEAIRSVTHEAGVRFLVNDRFDLAWAAGADGVHLGQGDLPPEALPAAARERLIVGLSTHDPAQLEAAAGAPVDYLAFGPVFGTTSKDSAYDARGEAALLRAVRAAAPRPLVAIGGMKLERAAEVLGAGAASVAVISDLMTAVDIPARVRAYLALAPGER